MDHFPIIQALCRSALPSASPAVRKQVERLRDALQKDGNDQQAASLTGLLTAAARSKEMVPSRIEPSRAIAFGGEVLSKGTPVPVDKETGAPLAEVIHPVEELQPPLFDRSVSEAISSLTEEWAHFESLSSFGLSPARSCLIYGPPGTGKTHLALWMARQLGLPVVLVRLDGLVSSFLGTTARNIGNLFSFANRYKCVLLLDEFDAIAKVRDDPQEVGEIKRVVNALLQNLDTRRGIGFTIGITNHSQLLDPAVWRRFEVQIEIPRPTFEIRQALVRHFMVPMSISDAFIKLMAWFMDGATGAEIELLSKHFKKAVALHGSVPDLIDMLRKFATLNAARIDEERRAYLMGEPAHLWLAIHEDSQLGFSMTDIGEVTGKDKSTISRQLGKISPKAAEEVH